METPQSGNLWVLRVILLLSIYCAGVSFAAPASLGRQQTETSAAPQEYDLKEYEVELDRCSESLKNSSEIHNLRSSLAPTWHVHVGKTSVEMSTEPIAAELRKLDARPQDAANITRDLSLRLGAMRKAAAEMETSGEREKPEAARKRLDQILARKEFQGTKGPSALNLYLARMSRWIVERLARFLMRLHIGSKSGNTLAWGVIILAFLALCYMVWRWLTGKSRIVEIGQAAKAAPRNTRQWAEEALAAAEREDFREAIHCAYWAALAKLEDINILARDHTRTPRESLRQLAHHPSEQRLLRDLTTHFELIWYGYRPASPSDWFRAKTELEKMGCLRASTAPTANS